MFKRTRITVAPRSHLLAILVCSCICATDTSVQAQETTNAPALAGTLAATQTDALTLREMVGTPLEPVTLTKQEAAYIRTLDKNHLADVESLRVRAIVEICGANAVRTNPNCILDFWSASDEEVDAALEEYREMSPVGEGE